LVHLLDSFGVLYTKFVAEAVSPIIDTKGEVIADGSSVAARVEISGTLIGEFAGISGDGQEFAVDQAIFMHISEGKADELWAIVDSDGFRTQVGAT
jgi:predicted ester cyclase